MPVFRSLAVLFCPGKRAFALNPRNKPIPNHSPPSISVPTQEKPKVAHESLSSPAATIRYAGDDFFVCTSPGGHSQVVDVSDSRKSTASPVEMLMMAIGACTAVDVVSILKKSRQEITSYRIEVTGERRSEHPRAFTRLEVLHVVRGRSISERSLAHAIQLSDEKYCSVAATLRSPTDIVTSYRIEEEDR